MSLMNKRLKLKAVGLFRVLEVYSGRDQDLMKKGLKLGLVFVLTD